MEALRDEAGQGVEVGAGTGPDGLDGRGPGRIDPLGGGVAQPPPGPARKARERLHVGEEELLGRLCLGGTVRAAALLLDTHEEPGVIQEVLSNLGIRRAVGAGEGLPLAR
jgi:hypothetical protein